MEKFLEKQHSKSIIWIYIILAIISIFEVGSTGSTLAVQYHQSPFHIIFKQIMFLSLGFIFMLIISRVPYPIYLKLAEFFYGFAIFLIILTLMIGTSINNSKRWLEIPVLSINFQTSEFVKIAVVFLTAKFLATEKNIFENTKQLILKISVYILPVIFLIMKNDNSTAFLIFTTVILMLFLAPTNKKILLKYLAVLFVGILLLVLLGNLFGIWRFNTLIGRIKNFLGFGQYDQALQAKIAIATGHFLIPVPGSSLQKVHLSHSYSDFIFSIIAEEFGIWGPIVVMFIYIFLLYKVGRIIRTLSRSYPVYLSIGLVLNIVIQAFVHIAVNVGLLPVTGQPLPLISLGGTSIIMTSFALGIILNIAEKSEIYSEIQKSAENQSQTSYQKKEDYPFIMG